MVEQLEVYTLTGKQPWANFVDSGNVHPRADVTLNTTYQHNVEDIWIVTQAVYSFQINARTAVIEALNDAVPEGYKNTDQLIGAKVYRFNHCPRTILDNLQATHGQITSVEKILNQQQFSEGWNPQEPIRTLFSCLE